MSAKLARLDQQEQEFMAKYGKKKQIDKSTPLSEVAPTELSSASDQERAEKTKRRKAKKKKQHSDEPKENGVQDETEASQKHNEEISKKRKKRSKDKAVLESEDATNFVDTGTNKKEKKTKLVLEEENSEMVQEGKVAETAEHQPKDESVLKKKRKKKKRTQKSSALEEGQSKITVLANEESAETTESHEHEQQEEGTTVLHPTFEVSKRKKSSKVNKDKSPAPEMESCCSLDTSTAEIVETADVKKESQSNKRKSRDGAETDNRSIDKLTEKKKKKRHAE